MHSDVASSPLSRAEWLAARAALAGHRIGRFALGAAVTFVTVLVALLLVPKLGIAVDREVPPVAMLATATLLAVILGFAASLLTETWNPTIANTREAEAIAQCPAFAVTRDDNRWTDTDAMDPFRMLYLGLTATGARALTVEVRGDARAVVATVAGRLALAAAGDTRATLVVDADAEGSPVAGYYRHRPEPGFTDAVAGVRLWREVTQAVGASTGLAIDVVPGGSLRREVPDAAILSAARAEFARFREEYDFCIAVASSDVAVARLNALLERPRVLLCAVAGRTTLASLNATCRRIRVTGATVYGIALWDAVLPQVAPRNELMKKGLTGRQ